LNNVFIGNTPAGNGRLTANHIANRGLLYKFAKTREPWRACRSLIIVVSDNVVRKLKESEEPAP
jgi:hypothetical protein